MITPTLLFSLNIAIEVNLFQNEEKATWLSKSGIYALYAEMRNIKHNELQYQTLYIKNIN